VLREGVHTTNVRRRQRKGVAVRFGERLETPDTLVEF
jgi:hypothetical protein